MTLNWTRIRSACKNSRIFLVALIVSGCIIPRAAVDEYSPPTSSELGELAVIHIYRVRAFFGGGNDFDILVDGKIAGDLGNGESLIVRIDPGIHTIERYDWTSPAQAPIFSYGKVGNSIEHNFQAGTEYYIRWKPFSLKEPGAGGLQFTDENLYVDRQ